MQATNKKVSFVHLLGGNLHFEFSSLLGIDTGSRHRINKQDPPVNYMRDSLYNNHPAICFAHELAQHDINQTACTATNGLFKRDSCFGKINRCYSSTDL